MAGKTSKNKASKNKASKGGSALTHIDASGEARMVDVSAKAATERTAVAEGRVVMTKATLELIVSGNAKKGDVLGAARIAGIMAAKRTSELIPLCHPLALSKVTLDITPDKKLPGCIVRATVKVTGPTGVEMEALTAVSVACLTIYDMIKAVERGVRIEGIHLGRENRRQVRAIIARADEARRLLRGPAKPVPSSTGAPLWLPAEPFATG